jgi:acyl-homoserine-lactone acylase
MGWIIQFRSFPGICKIGGALENADLLFYIDLASYFYRMRKFLILWFLLPNGLFAQTFSKDEIARWQQQAQRVTIIRDNWGIPHIYGKTDADAVFGLLYAQCEDDFPRVEANYIEKLGRKSEVEGNKAYYEDLLHRLVLDSAEAKKDYVNAPPWLKKLCNAFADGVNFYIAKNPQVKPALLTRFEPWWPFMWTDGSIGAISMGGANLRELESFYSGKQVAAAPPKLGDDPEMGSNGFAFAPKLTQSGKAILYINPHVTFYFRPEVHMVSEEGLNAYGAVTWGQFFIYQGFNENCGWMHTSSQADVADLYAEKISKSGDSLVYEFDGKSLPVIQRTVSISVLAEQYWLPVEKDVYETHHGPIVAMRDGKWLALKHHNRSAKGLEQSWLRTKAKSFAEFKQIMYMKENTSNNTVYADREGNIAYWHGNFVPKRDAKLDWSQPVDGSTSATEWQGLHMVDELVTIYNPASGWLQNCNQTPFTSSGTSSPKREDFPAYMAPDAENFRGFSAVKVWSDAKNLNLEKVIEGGYSRYLPFFDVLIPAMERAWQQREWVPDSLAADVEAAIILLQEWDRQSQVNSVATTVAIEWAQRLLPAINRAVAEGPNAGFVEKTEAFTAKAKPDDLLISLGHSLSELKRRFGTWEIPWGQINRYQRLTGAINETYSDTLPSIPVGFAAATWGSLPSYVSRQMSGTTKRYGYSGNSFICAVEFGDKVKAKSLLAGGNSNNPDSPHFDNQGEMYANGQFKEVLFYKADIEKNKKRVYKPGL